MPISRSLKKIKVQFTTENKAFAEEKQRSRVHFITFWVVYGA